MMSSRAAFACSPSTLNFERASVSRTLAERAAIEGQNQVEDVACERRHQNHDGLHVVILVDLRRLAPGRLRVTSEVRMRRSDVAAGVCDQARCRRRRVALSVALLDLQCAGHLAHSERSGLRSQPVTSHASAVTGTTTVDTWSSSSTSVGSPGGPSRFGCVAATPQEEFAFGLSMVTVAVHSRLPSRSTLRRPSGALGIDRSSEPSRRSRMRAPSAEPPRSTPDRPLRHPPDHPEDRAGIDCIAATSQEDLALDLTVIIIVACSRFISGDSTASSMRCIPRRLTRSRRRRAR